MFNKPSRSSRLTRTFGLALVASLALAGIAAAGASALSYVPNSGTYPAFFTAQGGQVSISTEAGNLSSCTGVEGNGKFTTGTSGQATLSLTGCKTGGHTCTSAGQSAGTILTSSLSAKPIYLDAAKTKFGLLLSPPLGQAFASFACSGIPFTWNGSLIGEITKPALNVSSTQADLAFEAAGPGVQKYQQIEGAGTKYRLTQTVWGGSPTGVAIQGLATLQFSGTGGKFIP